MYGTADAPRDAESKELRCGRTGAVGADGDGTIWLAAGGKTAAEDCCAGDAAGGAVAGGATM